MPTKGSPSDSQWLSQQKPYKPEEWGPIFNILNGKNFQPRISYPAKLSFISEGEIKSLMNKQLWKYFVTTRPALQELLKEVLNIERKNQYQPLQKMYQMVKTINTIKKLHQLMGKTNS